MKCFLARNWLSVVCWVALLPLVPACVGSSTDDSSSQNPDSHHPSPLANATILIIRHAEKPEFGSGLSAEGQARARAYVSYFENLRFDSKPVRIDYLVAAVDSEHSQRSRLTLEPLAQALGLKTDLRFLAREPQTLAGELQSRPYGKTILICWHHREIPGLLLALGADPERLLPHGQWPNQQFGWMLRLRYDAQGNLIRGKTKRIKEHLMPDD